ncbi:hypothetical protein BCON_0155g00150 [Botryotinia convoluta]|uniref:Uncharacterized protein n=1 Tax=Botryotinia convoluta TaxID=54673 RepID=A0A4Z1HX53_9HELO|nr:hypothetical protein BCON_0155g00150 [Botryotinia convoluta]
MASPKPTLKPKAKAPVSLSHLAGAPLSAPSSIPTGTMSPTKKSTKIKLQLKNKYPALPTPSEGAPVGASSSMPTGTMSPTKTSTETKHQLKNTAFPPPFTWPRKTWQVCDRDFYRSNRRTQTETPLETELQGHENESAAVKSSNGYAADDNSSPSTLAHTDEMPIEVPSLEKNLELLSLARLTSAVEAAAASASSSIHTENTTPTKPSKKVILKLPSAKLAALSTSTQAAWIGPSLEPTSSSTHTENTTPIKPPKPSKIVILKLSPAKLATLSTSTQAVWNGPSLKPASSSSNIASSIIKAPPLPIAATSAYTYSSRGRMIRKTYKAEQGGPRNNAVAQNAVAQIAGRKRKATKAATSSKKRVKFANTDEAQNINIAADATSNKNHESAETTKSHKVTVARRTRIKIGTRSPPLRSKARAKGVLEASREALQRAHLLAWQEEEEARNRHARAKMANLLRDWTALEEQRDLEAEQANTGAL